MLLLILVLVLIALGLLLVGFLSNSVMWAFVSVGVSLVALVFLAIDWISRRSAVKAGDESGGEDPSGGDGDGRPDPSTPEGPTAVTRYPDIEPVTEAIPIIRSSGYGPPQVGYGPQGAPRRPGVPVGRGVEPRFDPDADALQTVMMPAVGPPGSPAEPSGAAPGITSSSESSSPNVTTTRAVRSSTDSGENGSTGQPVERPADVAVPAVGAIDDPTIVVAAAGSARAAAVGSGPAAAGPAGSDPADSSPGGGPGRAASTTPATAAGGSAASGTLADATAFGSGAAVPVGGTASTAADAPAADAPAGSGPVGSTGSSGNGATRHGGSAHGGSANGGPVGGTAPPAVGGWSPDGDRPPVDESPVCQPVYEPVADPVEVAATSDGDAPEERPDAAAAALVAGLDDEVLVIDEQPRYHVPGCRTLLTASLIPLPAHEAVELGFTPCGWCTPDRTLAGRHPATAR